LSVVLLEMRQLWPGGAIGEAKMATVLVVEDEAIIRDMVAEELEDAGFTVVIAMNAAGSVASDPYHHHHR
jgi:hypothetical protein